jgi:hypothetical protein
VPSRAKISVSPWRALKLCCKQAELVAASGALPQSSWLPLSEISRRGISRVEINLDAEAVRFSCQWVLPACFEWLVPGPSRCVAKPAIVDEFLIEQVGAD